MFLARRSRCSAVTFDLGRAGVRAYQFLRRGGEVALCDSLQLEVPPKRDSDDAAVGGHDADRLARLIGQGRFRGRDVALVLSPPDVQFHTLRLPEQVLSRDEQRIHEALKWEVSRETRTEPQSLEVRYWRLPPGHRQDLNVMAVAMPTEQAVAWFERFEQQGFTLRRVDVSPCALVRLARRMWTPGDTELWGLLDIGHHQATFTAVIGTVPTYVRSLSISADQCTDRLAAGLDVSHTAAEQLKREHGIQAQGRRAREPAAGQAAIATLIGDDLAGVLLGLLREPLDGLIREIDRCLSYVMQNFRDLSVTRLLLAGGGSRLPGLSAFLNLHLGMPVAPLSASDQPDEVEWQEPLPDLHFGPEAAAAIGGVILDMEAA